TLMGVRSDGTEFPVEIALSPLEAPEGPLYLASCRDISGTQRVRQALARARYDAIAAQVGQLALGASTIAEVLEVLPPCWRKRWGAGRWRCWRRPRPRRRPSCGRRPDRSGAWAGPSRGPSPASAASPG